ncbi:nuclear transport factor 2 family protein [Aestuariicella hydrocarbonica]|uniref:Nuclear transport factor 2 family protein n=1 Tax=Pseudomaricurvus hydrocarbonicus TaxID=1470433 RepID=A0A9E5MKT7_9GAMM|nr:nuclear transport factor 2 family protein [Aestuariicella hydrocarbonica]NHO65812.1 nuclear transport factor 2 family protein [Aestuariicella hydrocarbonica]
MTISTTDFFHGEACKALSIAFANAVDQRDYSRAANVFSNHAEFSRWDGKVFNNLEAIKGMLDSRDESIQTRHICTNIEITNITDCSARGITYFVFFNGEGRQTETLPLTGPKFVGEYHDDFICENGIWKIQKRRVRIVFGDIG